MAAANADLKGLYKALEVPVEATADEIKKAYRKKALVLHPDKNPDNPEATKLFQEVGSAYAVLSNPEKKQRYDSTGKVGDDDDDIDDMDMDLLMEMFMGAFDGIMMDDLHFMNSRPRKAKGKAGKFGKGRSAKTRPRGGPGLDMPPGMAAMFGGLEMDEDDIDDELLFELFSQMDGGKQPGGKKKKKGKKDDEPSPEELLAFMEMMGGAPGLDIDIDDDDELELDPGMAELLFAMGGPPGAGRGGYPPGPVGPVPAAKRGGVRRKARGRR